MAKLSNLTRHAIQVLAFVALVAVTVLSFPRYNSSFRYHVEQGKPWGYEKVTAEFDFPIYKTPAQLEMDRRTLLADFAPCFVRDTAVQDTLLVASIEDVNYLEKGGYQRVALLSGHSSTYYPVHQVLSPKQAYQVRGAEVSPTILLDTANTNRLLSQLEASISPTQGVVLEGQKIIDRGELVTDEKYQILTSLERACAENDAVTAHQRTLSTTGRVIMVCLYLGLFVLYLLVFRRRYLQSLSAVLFFALLSGIVIVMSCAMLQYTSLSIYLIPFAWVPVITRVFYDARTALFLHIVTVLIVSLIVPAPVEFFFLQIAAGMVAVSSLSDMTRRSQLAQTAGWVLLTYSLAYTGYTFASTGDYLTIHPYTYLYFALNVALIIMAYGLIFLFEKTFRLLSSITLVELTDINSDLLHRLAEEAPGTFQHSMQVSNLASEAAKAIGANALLVRTGALYHDIGKLSNPGCFIENQHAGHNPLLECKPEEAVRIIISHVTEGEALARKHHLPEMVIHFITTHHGTSLVRYFYNSYVNAHPGEEVRRLDFQYPGPKPTTREAAILMMADAVEARSRSLKEYTEEEIYEMVDTMIDTQIADGQFSETPLSFKDVEDIREVFKLRLMAINHQRISYPTLNKV